MIQSNIYKLDQVDSTNNYLKRNRGLLEENFLSIRTDHQVSGRGRNNREWNSVPGCDLTCSTVFHASDHLKSIQAVSIYTGIAILRVLKSYISSEKLKIKWPNDIYLGEQKLSGILCELVKHNHQNCVIIGIGINVNSSHCTDQKIISMRDIISRSIDLERLHKEIVGSLKEVFTHFEYPIQDTILHEWLENNCSVGRDVIYGGSEERLYGKVVHMNADCSLLVLNKDHPQLTSCYDNVVFI